MKYLKLFENFKDKSDLEKELDRYDIKNYTINSDGTIDVDGDVDLFYRPNNIDDSINTASIFLQSNIEILTKIPFKFGKVSGDFACSNNEIDSLEGCPYFVGGDFRCRHNKLTSLIGSPKEVGGYFDCSHNELESLEGMPLEISKYFICVDNPNLKELDSLSNIEGDILCSKNIDISKFKGYCKNIYNQYS